ncbi:AAA domain-containing protein [Aureispira anguillae]|uniref:AAA domain-containing protein n=1 Tax=Aureispira anguillae TaxID=2864201 RepID=A0A915YDU3_9BACT|nr:AAA domain-containing protein [Aureispira anguillae]BDS11282.1 AAA domain-containing protein [Aureispira anguillae]
MKQINQYVVLQELKQFNDQIKVWLSQDSGGATYELLTIAKQDNNSRRIERVLNREIKPWVHQTIEGIQPIKEVGEDENNNCYFIAYLHLEDYRGIMNAREEASVQSILDIVKGLSKLKMNNFEAYAISPQFVRVNFKGRGMLCWMGVFELLAHYDLLERPCLAANVIDWMDNKADALRPNFQDDIYSLLKSFKSVLKQHERHTAVVQLLSKGLEVERIKRFSNYHQVIQLLEELPIKTPQDEDRRAIRVVVNKKKIDAATLRLLLKDMSNGVYMDMATRRSTKGTIEGNFSTSDWNGKFVLNNDRSLFIPHCNNQANDKVLKAVTAFRLDASFTEYATNYDCRPFFTEKFEQKCELAALHRKQRNLLTTWKVLPQNEQAVIEADAFKVNYTRREETKKGDFKFYLAKDSEVDWTLVRKVKNEQVVLWIGQQAVGSIGNYEALEFILTITAPFCLLDEVPKTGTLMQDVRQETSQFRKQVDACEKFQQSDVANPALCSILATPETVVLPNNKRLFQDDYDRFNATLFNEQLANDTTQSEAVLEGLNQKPIYLIQGPPGTGKTTVIVELIQQIIQQKKTAKILLTSQSNLAVDNVLERIKKINESAQQSLPFIRLASTHAIEKENVTPEVLPHTFERKLDEWTKGVSKRSERHLETLFPKEYKQKELIQLYHDYASLKGKAGWKTFVQKLKLRSTYLKRLFENCDTLPAAELVFQEVLGQKFLELKQIQRDWVAFLNGVNIDIGSHKKQAMLRDGSTEVDFLTAMMRDINIIGATCIHIASGKYSRINFQFDYVIMDESSKASPPETLVPINMGRNIILIGDHKQLPPVVTRDKKVRKNVKEELEDNGLDFNKEFGTSLFETLIEAFQKDDKKSPFTKMLNIQYRMPRQIGSLISRFFYEGKLQNPSFDIPMDKEHGLKFKKETSIVFISTSNRENPSDNGNLVDRKNNCNAKVIEETLEKLNALYAGNLERKQPLTIGVIAGYRGQVALLKKIDLAKYNNFVVKPTGADAGKKDKYLIEINTVDQFQGTERDIIIYDVVRSSPNPRDVIGFLDDYRRINVAFSRVKRLLLVIGDRDYLLDRAILHPKSNFSEFKLQQIVAELDQEGLVYNNLDEILDQ